MKSFYVYILTNQRNGTLYIGVTSNIEKRMLEHSNKVVKSFSKKYSLNILVFLEKFESIDLAIQREKQLKRWHRSWKINLIEQGNPKWLDLSKEYTLY